MVQMLFLPPNQWCQSTECNERVKGNEHVMLNLNMVNVVVVVVTAFVDVANVLCVLLHLKNYAVSVQTVFQNSWKIW